MVRAEAVELGHPAVPQRQLQQCRWQYARSARRQPANSLARASKSRQPSSVECTSTISPEGNFTCRGLWGRKLAVSMRAAH